VTERDFAALERMIIDCFEPITWQKTLDDRIGPLNGRDWRQRWSSRLAKIFETQEVWVGELDGQIAAMASAVVDESTSLGFIDVLGVSTTFQGRGLGRDMLRGMIEHLKTLGCKYVNLDCLTDNEAGNELYKTEGFEEVARHIRWFKRI
jgi:ribosomal protein S18 acetylase RimI-like enzyme